MDYRPNRFTIFMIAAIPVLIILVFVYSYINPPAKVVYPTEFATELAEGDLSSLHVDGFELRPGTTLFTDVEKFFRQPYKKEEDKEARTLRSIYGDEGGKYNRMILEFSTETENPVLTMAYVEYAGEGSDAQNIYVADELTVKGATTDDFRRLYPDAAHYPGMGRDEFQSQDGISNTIVFSGSLDNDLYAICVIINDPEKQEYEGWYTM